MAFGRVKVSAAQRRWLQMMESIGSVVAASPPAPTRRKLVELGYAEIQCSHCKRAAGPEDTGVGFRLVITEAGRKYLANWRKAYG